MVSTGAKESVVLPDGVAKTYDVVWKGLYLTVVVLVGNSGVGKTNFLTRYAYNQFSQDSRTTIGIDFACKDITHNGRQIRLQVWDTAGQERFRVLAHLYYSRAVAIILLYDITKHTSFQDISQRWLKEVEDSENLEKPVLILVGHKYDLRHLRSVTQEEGQNLASKHSMVFIEASAMDDYNISETFDLLVEAVAQRQAMKALEYPPPSEDLGAIITISRDERKKKKKLKSSACCKT